MLNKRPRHGKRCNGFTLLEVLVALVVLSIGLLGLSGLQNVSLRNNHSAYLRSQATVMSQDILDRMRANNEEWESYLAVSPATSVAADLAEWQANVARLPDGAATLQEDDGIVTVTVSWADDRQAVGSANNQGQFVTRARF